VRSSRPRTREAGAILLLAVALPLLRVTTAGAEDPEVQDARIRLARVTAALESEAGALAELAADPQAAGTPIDLAGYLADAEVRVWELQVEGSEAVPLGLGEDVAAYRGALESMLTLLRDAVGEAVTGAGGLPLPGRACPVDGPTALSNTWAEERPWGRSHKGEDLLADAGTPLVAVESGTVLQAGWHWQGGFGVWLAGLYSRDVYYYAHLSGIAPGIRPGAEVEVGALVGWVGSTGNATSPHLHFGWIPDETEHWAALTGLANPYALLAGLCR